MKRESMVFQALLAAVVLAAGCSRSSNPCGAGAVLDRTGDRCMPLTAATDPLGGDAGLDATITPPGVGGDVGTPDTPAKPGTDAEVRDAGADPVQDATVQPPADASAGAPDAMTPEPVDAGADAAVVGDDAGAPNMDAAVDAALPGDAGAIEEDAGDAQSEPPLCSADDVEAWRAFHLSDALVATILQCAKADPACARGACALDACVRDAVGLVGCDDCVRAEVACVAKSCTKACGASSNDDACRACACENGCVDAFDQCAGEALDVCADCDGKTCSNMSVLRPELIMVIVNQVLLGT